MLQTEELNYDDASTQCKGYLAYEDNATKKPLILIAHDWTGRTEFTENKAKALAALGYVGFAIDMYGEKKTGKDNTEKAALMTPLINNRPALFQRIHAAVKAASQLNMVDKTKIAAMGFCFGGLCALDLARNSHDIAGVIALHANLSPPDTTTRKISAKVIAFHGHDDPLVPMQQVRNFENEMTQANCDWQLIIYGGTKHAFTNPLANDPGFGTVYNPIADKRSWYAVQNFLNELFS